MLVVGPLGRGSSADPGQPLPMTGWSIPGRRYKVIHGWSLPVHVGEAMLRTEMAATNTGLGVALPNARAPRCLLLLANSHKAQPLIEPPTVCELGGVSESHQGGTRGLYQVNVVSVLVPVLSLELLRKKSQSILRPAATCLGL